LTTYHHQHLFWEMSRKPTGKPATVKGHQSSLPSSIAIMGKEVSPASLQNTMMSSTIDNKYLDTIKGGADGDASLLSLISVVLYFISHLCKAFEDKKITSKEKKYRFLRNYFQNLPEHLHNSFKTVIQTVEHIDEQKTNSIAIPESSLSFAAAHIRDSLVMPRSYYPAAPHKYQRLHSDLTAAIDRLITLVCPPASSTSATAISSNGDKSADYSKKVPFPESGAVFAALSRPHTGLVSDNASNISGRRLSLKAGSESDEDTMAISGSNNRFLGPVGPGTEEFTEREALAALVAGAYVWLRVRSTTERKHVCSTAPSLR